MMLIKTVGIHSFILLVGYFLSGCAQPTVVRTSYIAPANSQEATKLRRVAVLPFSKKNNEDVTSNVEQVLAEATLNDQNYFTVVERNKLDSLLKEMKLGESGALTSTTIARVGRMVGAAGVYAGAVTNYDVRNEPYRENRERCVYTTTERGKNGVIYETCAKSEIYSVPCNKRIGVYSFIPKLIEVETGVIRYSRELSSETFSKACSDSATGVRDGQQLLAEAKKYALNQLRQDVTPHLTTVAIVILESSDLIQPSADKDSFNRAVAFAKGGRLDRACEIWGGIANNTTSPDLLYDKGVCSETAGNLTEALALFIQADRLTDKPVDVIGKALERVRKIEEDRKKLQSQTAKQPGHEGGKKLQSKTAKQPGY